MNDFVEKDGPLVSFRDNHKGRTQGFGSIQYNSMNFKDVSYVSGLRYDIISVNQLCEAGYNLFFSKEEGNIVDSRNSILLTTIRKNNIYMSYVISV